MVALFFLLCLSLPSVSSIRRTAEATLTNDTVMELLDKGGVRSQGERATAQCGYVNKVDDCTTTVTFKKCKDTCCDKLEAEPAKITEYCGPENILSNCAACRKKTEPTSPVKKQIATIEKRIEAGKAASRNSRDKPAEATKKSGVLPNFTGNRETYEEARNKFQKLA
mmetsp:Transcript_12104/g.19858  ORF Transcript_12104/g.19858 Transcript_12104/m.19858 type:complete len:167 (+) Transcript_12104:68-568(+)